MFGIFQTFQRQVRNMQKQNIICDESKKQTNKQTKTKKQNKKTKHYIYFGCPWVLILFSFILQITSFLACGKPVPEHIIQLKMFGQLRMILLPWEPGIQFIMFIIRHVTKRDQRQNFIFVPRYFCYQNKWCCVVVSFITSFNSIPCSLYK